MSVGQAAAHHASAVLVGHFGLLLRGPSGSGKSALAMALIGAGARLVADDYVYLTPRAGRLVASAPSPTAGLIELRGAGILRFPYEPSVIIRLIADLVAPEKIERMPEPARVELAGVDLARLAVPAPGLCGAVEPALMLIRQAVGHHGDHNVLHLPKVSP